MGCLVKLNIFQFHDHYEEDIKFEEYESYLLSMQVNYMLGLIRYSKLLSLYINLKHMLIIALVL